MEIKKICIFIRDLKTGGAQKQSLLLAKVLHDTYDVSVVVQQGKFVNSNNVRFIKENKINLIRLQGLLLKRLFNFYKFLRDKDIHIIFSYLTSDNFWAAIIGTLAGVKYLAGGIRSILLPWHKFHITKLLHKFYLDYVIFNSHSGLQSFVDKGFLLEKCRVITNSIDISYPAITRNDKKKLGIITVSRFSECKDFHTAIKAINHLKKLLDFDSIEFEYLIIGIGEEEKQIRKWIKEYDLSNEIKIIVNPKNLNTYYIESDIYLSTSLYEGISNSLLEAMSFSLPIVATDVGDNKLLVKNEINGYLTQLREFEEIALRLIDLVISYEKRISFGLASYKLLEEKFTMNRFQKDYIDFIEYISK